MPNDLEELPKNEFVLIVQDVQINGKPGAYAEGAWEAQFVPDMAKPNGGVMVSTWRNDPTV